MAAFFLWTWIVKFYFIFLIKYTSKEETPRLSSEKLMQNKGFVSNYLKCFADIKLKMSL